MTDNIAIKTSRKLAYGNWKNWILRKFRVWIERGFLRRSTQDERLRTTKTLFVLKEVLTHIKLQQFNWRVKLNKVDNLITDLESVGQSAKGRTSCASNCREYFENKRRRKGRVVWLLGGWCDFTVGTDYHMRSYTCL